MMKHHQNSDWRFDLPLYDNYGYQKRMYVDSLDEHIGTPNRVDYRV